MAARAPHFVRFCRALALLSGASLVVGCSSNSTSTETSDAKSDSPYDGVVVGVAPCDGGCGVTFDGGVKPYDGGDDSAYDGETTDTAYDGHPVGVTPYDGGSDVPPGGGPGCLPDLPFLG